MVQTLQVPNTRAVKIIGEQSTGAETAVLVDASGHPQVDIVSGAVADSAAAALLTTIDADTSILSAEVVAGDGLMVRSDTAANMLVTEASGAGILAKLDAATSTLATQATLATIDADTSILAAEVAVGDGLMVRSDTAANMLVTEASAAGILAKLDAATSTLATQATLATIDADTSALSAEIVAAGAGLRVEQGYTFSHLAAAGQVKATGGFVHSVTLNTAGTASVVTLYDNPAAAGNVVGIYTIAVGSISPTCLVLDVACPNGIYVDMTVAVDVTVSYR